MKNILMMAGLLIMLFSVSCYAEKQETAETDSLVWHGSIETAVDQALEEARPILVNFTGSDWCGWCKKLKGEVFSQTEFADYAKESLYLVKLDYPKYIQQDQETVDYNRAKLENYDIRGFPTILLLDPSGAEITRTGYVPGGPVNYINHLESLLPDLDDN